MTVACSHGILGSSTRLSTPGTGPAGGPLSVVYAASMGGTGSAVRVVIVALIASITQIALTVAFTSLTFRDELSAELALGLAAMFLGMLITAVAVGISSGLPGHIASPQDGGLVMLSVVAPTIAATSDAPGETLVVLMGLSSLAVGATLLALGRSGLGRTIRYLPYPVLAGFLAGTGLVMGQGALALAAHGIGGDATGGRDRIARLIVVIVVALLMTAISRSSLSSELYVPPVVVGSILAFHLVAAILGIGRGEGAERGWLLPILPSGSLFDADTFTVVARADWGVVVENLPAMAPLLLLAPLTVLLYLGAFESSLDADIDSDREFQVMGRAGAVAGLFGSAPSYTQFANTMLVQRMAGPVRAVPIAVGLSAVVVLLLGDSVIALIPQPVVVGLLGFIALSFILDWTWGLRDRISHTELALAVLVAFSIPVFGFPIGVGFGLVLTSGWFVVQYSRISGVRRIRDARRVRSNVFRSADDDLVLVDAGRQVLIVELEGFLFFGTGDAVGRRVTAWDGLDEVRRLLIDFTRVSGADSSAVASFGQLVRWARQRNVEIIWVAMNPGVRRALSPLLAVCGPGTTEVDLDRALATIEDEQLAARSLAPRRHVAALLELPVVADAELRRLAAGDVVLHAGQEVDGIFVVESGRVSVLGGAPDTRLRQLGRGAVLGELGLYTDAVATATVVADDPVTLRHVDAHRIEQLERDDPAAAALLHRRLATAVAERLRTANDAVDAFRDRGGDHIGSNSDDTTR